MKWKLKEKIKHSQEISADADLQLGEIRWQVIGRKKTAAHFANALDANMVDDHTCGV